MSLQWTVYFCYDNLCTLYRISCIIIEAHKLQILPPKETLLRSSPIFACSKDSELPDVENLLIAAKIDLET